MQNLRSKRRRLALSPLVWLAWACTAAAQIPAAPGSAPRDEEPGRVHEAVPVPAVPEKLAVPDETPSPKPTQTATPMPREDR